MHISIEDFFFWNSPQPKGEPSNPSHIVIAESPHQKPPKKNTCDFDFANGVSWSKIGFMAPMPQLFSDESMPRRSALNPHETRRVPKRSVWSRYGQLCGGGVSCFFFFRQSVEGYVYKVFFLDVFFGACGRI